MRFAIVVFLILIIAGIIQYQIIEQNSQRRRDNCKTTITSKGLYREATSYEFYSCLSK